MGCGAYRSRQTLRAVGETGDESSRHCQRKHHGAETEHTLQGTVQYPSSGSAREGISLSSLLDPPRSPRNLSTHFDIELGVKCLINHVYPRDGPPDHANNDIGWPATHPETCSREWWTCHWTRERWCRRLSSLESGVLDSRRIQVFIQRHCAHGSG